MNEINEKHIAEAEKFLIDGKKFDNESDGKKERIDFINNLETCDLLAVPGSGKTTALMAKLYCLSKQMPFSDGSGILVLAHTNAAVDEIEKKLKKHCPDLFEYPNFVGTIQSFINKFLANQACFEKYGIYIKRNEDDFIHKDILNKVKSNYSSAYWVIYNAVKSKYNNLDKNFIAKHNSEINDEEAGNIILNLQRAKFLNTKLSLNYDYKKVIESNLNEIEKKIIFQFNKDLEAKAKSNSALLEAIKTFNYNEKDSYFTSERLSYNLNTSTVSGKELKDIFEQSYNSGNLIFNDSFRLAKEYLYNYPQIRSILQKRFKYVFIDEMQDLEEYQIKIIDKIFEEGKSSTVIQRIGDINQSIYNIGKTIKIECDWKPRKEMYLTDSNRLTKSNAELVDFFTLDKKEGKFNVIGKRVIENGDIKPHLILYKKDTKSRLRDKFEEIIKSNNLHTLLEIKDKKDEKEKFKIIGWAGERTNEEDDNLCLKDIFGYSKLQKSKKEYHTTLSKYIQLFDKDKKTLEATRKSILNALITVLYFQGNLYTITQLIDFIKIHKQVNGEEVYEDFKLKLYLWSFELATLKNYEVVFNSIKEFIKTDFINWFNYEVITTETNDFISSFQEEKIIKEEIEVDETKLNIDIATVHSVKGQTHIATMYVETFNYEYETKKAQIKDVLLGNNHTFKIGESNGKTGGEKDARGKQALKMMYVGFSRPTHLLCFAVLKENLSLDNLSVDELKKLESYWNIDKTLIE